MRCREQRVGSGQIGKYGRSRFSITSYANILVILSLMRRLVRPFLLRLITSPPASLSDSAPRARLARTAPSEASSKSRQPLAYESLYLAKRPKTGNVEERKDTKSRTMEQPTSVTAGRPSAMDIRYKYRWPTRTARRRAGGCP